MNDIAAVIGIEQLKYVDDLVKKHINNANFYDRKFTNIDHIKLIPRSDNAVSSSWLYTIHIDTRDDFMQYMQNNGIQSSKVHERNDKHTATRDYQADLPLLESFIDEMVCIPVGWWVGKEERAYIVDSIKEGW